MRFLIAKGRVSLPLGFMNSDSPEMRFVEFKGKRETVPQLAEKGWD